MEDWLANLTPAQLEAVTHFEGPLLILAGAGSGKTRVITRRVAHLLRTGVRPGQILAITFTNKAAAEMRERIANLVGGSADGMWISTFHSACVRILRRQAEAMGMTGSFTIYAGTLDDPSTFHPTMAIFTRDRPEWVILPAGLRMFEAMPSD